MLLNFVLIVLLSIGFSQAYDTPGSYWMRRRERQIENAERRANQNGIDTPVGSVGVGLTGDVHIPFLYDLSASGRSTDTKVLSGLVEVETGRSARRNGLVGPNPVSVRVLGLPIYDRGTRVRAPDSGPLGLSNGLTGGLTGGLANGLTGGLANGLTGGLSGGLTNGLTGGLANGLTGGLLNFGARPSLGYGMGYNGYNYGQAYNGYGPYNGYGGSYDGYGSNLVI